MGDVPGSEDNGVGRGGDRQHEGAAGGDGGRHDQHEGVQVEHNCQGGQYGDKRGRGGRIAGQFREEDHQRDHGHDEQQRGNAGQNPQLVTDVFTHAVGPDSGRQAEPASKEQ